MISRRTTGTQLRLVVFLQYAKALADTMISQFESASVNFIRVMWDILGRPSRKTKARRKNQKAIHSQPWRVPMQIPKSHSLLFHVLPFIRIYRYWGLFSEQSFEHYHQVSARNRRTRTPNESDGSSICVDLTFSWAIRSPNGSMCTFLCRKQSNSSRFGAEEATIRIV